MKKKNLKRGQPLHKGLTKAFKSVQSQSGVIALAELVTGRHIPHNHGQIGKAMRKAAHDEGIPPDDRRIVAASTWLLQQKKRAAQERPAKKPAAAPAEPPAPPAEPASSESGAHI